jgi:3-hydroxyisobutyrate dehydrogenase
MMDSVGFVGIGNMGWPMAAHIHAAGYALLVADLRRDVAENFVQQVGGAAPDSMAQLADGSDIIITMLPTSAAVGAALDSLLPAIRPGAIVIDMTSGAPGETLALAARVAQAGGRLIDAPVSGGVPRARTGQLAIMVGGDDAIVARVEPLLKTLGSSILRTGAVGSAHAMKALNNLVSAGGFLIGIEALLIGQRFGLDPDMMIDVLNASTGMNNATQKKFRQYVLSRSFDSGFSLDLMLKDVSIALGVAKETATPAPFSALCRELSAACAAMLGPGADHTELAKLSERLAGVELGRPLPAPYPHETK